MHAGMSGLRRPAAGRRAFQPPAEEHVLELWGGESEEIINYAAVIDGEAIPDSPYDPYPRGSLEPNQGMYEVIDEDLTVIHGRTHGGNDRWEIHGGVLYFDIFPEGEIDVKLDGEEITPGGVVAQTGGDAGRFLTDTECQELIDQAVDEAVDEALEDIPDTECFVNNDCGLGQVCYDGSCYEEEELFDDGNGNGDNGEQPPGDNGDFLDLSPIKLFLLVLAGLVILL